MTIFFLARSLNFGGAERQLVVLAKGLKEEGYDVIVAVFYGGGQFEKELKQSGVTFEDLNKGGRWEVFSFLLRLAALLKRSKPSVVYGFLSLPNVLLVLLHKLVPNAKVVWGVRATDPDFSHYNWLVPLVYKAENYLARYSDLVIVNSDAGRRDCEKRRFSTSKLVVIPNGIDTVYFSPDNKAGKAFRTQHGVLDNEKLIGVVGRLDPMKGHPAFLAAFALVRKEVSRVKALIVGEKSELHEDYLKALHKQAEELDIGHLVIWAQPCEAMPAVYSAIDILVSSSSFGEGFSNVIAEAMSCATPCVATRVGDSAKIVGNLGVVVEPDNVDALARAIVKTLSVGRADPIRRQVRQRIKNHFSIEKYIKATELAICPRV